MRSQRTREPEATSYLAEVPVDGGATFGLASPAAGRMRSPPRVSGSSVVPAVLRPSNGPTLGAAVGPGTWTTLPFGPLMLAPGALGGPKGRSGGPAL